jgi:transposase InsO family protein
LTAVGAGSMKSPLHGGIRDCRYLLHDDRDTKYTQSFRAIIASCQVKPLVLPARSPNLNAYAERWVRSVKEECLSKVILSLSETYALKYW